MGWRFRKTIKIAPGIKINLSKSGFSTTVGTRGASVNYGKNGAYLNTGIPGTGLFSRQRITSKYSYSKSCKKNSFGTSPYKRKTSKIGCLRFFIFFLCLFIVLMLLNWTILLFSGERQWSNLFLIGYLLFITLLIIIIFSYKPICRYIRNCEESSLNDIESESNVNSISEAHLSNSNVTDSTNYEVIDNERKDDSMEQKKIKKGPLFILLVFILCFVYFCSNSDNKHNDKTGYSYSPNEEIIVKEERRLNENGVLVFPNGETITRASYGNRRYFMRSIVSDSIYQIIVNNKDGVRKNIIDNIKTSDSTEMQIYKALAEEGIDKVYQYCNSPSKSVDITIYSNEIKELLFPDNQ